MHVVTEDDEFSLRRVSMLLFVTYSLFIFAVTSPPPLYATMASSLHFDVSGASTILAAQTMGSAIGKVTCGFFIDSLGGSKSILCSHILIAISLLLISFSETLYQVVICASIMEFVGSPVWPGHAMIIRGWFPTARLSDAFWVLSMSSRCSDMTSKLLYGVLQGWVSWRSCLRIAAFFCLINVCVTAFEHSDTKPAATQTNNNTEVTQPRRNSILAKSREMLFSGLQIMRDKRFLISATALSLLTITKRIGQLIPLYFSMQAHGILTDGQSATISLVFPAGLFTGILIFGGMYGRLESVSKIRLCTWLNVVSVLCCVALAFLSPPAYEDGTTEERCRYNDNINCPLIANSRLLVFIKAALLFVCACGIATSFYIIPSVFSVQFGGKNTGTVSAFLDFFGMSISALFIRCVVGPVIDSNWGWAGIWAILSITTTLGMVVTIFSQRQLYISGLGSEPPGARKVCSCSTARASNSTSHWSWWWLVPGTEVPRVAPPRRYQELSTMTGSRLSKSDS